MPVKPTLLLHTGDIAQSANPEQFNLVQSALSELGIPINYMPDEYDLANGENVQPCLDRFCAGTKGTRW